MNANKTPGYEQLEDVLRAAFDQAAGGKGAERHGNGLPFHKQRMQSISELLDTDAGMAFQACKKVSEAMRLPHDARERELLGAINYIAGMVIFHRSRSTTFGKLVEQFDEPARGIDDESPRQQAIGQNGNTGEHYCECHACIDEFNLGTSTGIHWWPLSSTKMILCPTCGNKRCPHASDHRLSCTNSNEPGQPGSVYGGMTLEPSKAEPERPRHLCATCGQGHATHQCNTGQSLDAPKVRLVAKPELPSTDELVPANGKPKWEHAPTWAMYLTQDKKGVWTFWQHKPSIVGEWWIKGNGCMQEFNSGEVVGRWQDSLEEAPGRFESGERA